MNEPTRRAPLVLAGMTVANAMVLVDQTAVPLALPEIMSRFGVGSQPVQWVLNGSLVVLAGMLVLGGQLADLLGRRRIFLIGTIIFALASTCAALAPTFGLLILCRVVQGASGALMLPTTVALVSATFAGPRRGAALGTMGGMAAVAGAAGPVIGGVLTSTLGWPSVFLINLPLGIATAAITLVAVPADPPPGGSRGRIDLPGAALLALALIALIVGLGQSQSWGVDSPAVWALLVLAVAGGVAFLVLERRRAQPLVDLGMLGRSPNYRLAVLSQALGGAAEMGLAVILPLLLILNLGLDPGLAGLALLPASLPLVFIAPVVGRWYDRVGARPPLMTGYTLLALSGPLLATGGFTRNYWLLLPGLMAYGLGLAVVLTVNDPVSLSDVPETAHGQAAGVAATAEQFGGALGIAVLYLLFHTTYVLQLYAIIDRGPLADLSTVQYERLSADIEAAETTGLKPDTFDPLLSPYLQAAERASSWGYLVAFLGVTLIGVTGVVLAARAGRSRRDRGSQPEAATTE